MRRSTRRKHLPPGASAAGLPEENRETGCEESSEFVPSPKLRGLRSSRKGLAQDDGDTGDGDNGDAPEPEASVGRPRRERKRKLEEVISVEAKKVKKVRKKPSRPRKKRPPKPKLKQKQIANAKPRAEGAAGRKHDSLGSAPSSTSQPAEDQSKENVADAGVEESMPPMADAEAHDDEVVIEASITHAHVDTTFVEERSVTSDLVIALEAAHIGSTPAAQGSCSPTDMANPSAGAPDEHITESGDNGETSPATETVSEVTAEAANTGGDSVKEHNSGTQAETEDVGEKGDTAGGPAPSRIFSMLQRSVEDGGLTPNGREKITLGGVWWFDT